MSGQDAMIEDEPVGYGRPPRATRFRKGQSGNPAGRPRNRRKEIPYDTVLGQMVTIREEGRERRVTAAEAFLLHLTRKGLAGDNAAARASLAAIEQARERRGGKLEDQITVIRILAIGFGIGSTLEKLGLAKKIFPLDRERVRWLLNPWIVEAALKRLGTSRLSLAEQKEVWDATRTPQKVTWPEWWGWFGD